MVTKDNKNNIFWWLLFLVTSGLSVVIVIKMIIIVSLVIFLSLAHATPLDDYVNKPDPNFKWVDTGIKIKVFVK